ncbi:RNA polymerase sigma factor [Planctomyces sp. SH-PL14]|uniref:RNA polymerase sigma factor n=1 Tax=Planctomyces sp. SH-PL14 TaxID=1632864 RepID=UPI00078B1D27|nr:sigma-70 family RNA polymerase sigma factor [Planctomyces sp. SH-PL14]AMV20131.1 ECF RNA polymerase sigma factor SigW [Planctomyces sp. SH-PL14]
MSLNSGDESIQKCGERERWVASTVRRALAYALTLVRRQHDAEDIVQECYRRLLTRADRYDLPRDGAKILFKSITNACFNHLKRRRPAVSIEGGAGMPEVSTPVAGTGPDLPVLEQELQQAIGRALAELPVNQRAVVELSSLGHPLVDVAEMVGLSPGNTRVLLHRARQMLAERLREFREEKS